MQQNGKGNEQVCGSDIFPAEKSNGFGGWSSSQMLEYKPKLSTGVEVPGLSNDLDNIFLKIADVSHLRQSGIQGLINDHLVPLAQLDFSGDLEMLLMPNDGNNYLLIGESPEKYHELSYERALLLAYQSYIIAPNGLGCQISQRHLTIIGSNDRKLVRVSKEAGENLSSKYNIGVYLGSDSVDVNPLLTEARELVLSMLNRHWGDFKKCWTSIFLNINNFNEILLGQISLNIKTTDKGAEVRIGVGDQDMSYPLFDDEPEMPRVIKIITQFVRETIEEVDSLDDLLITRGYDNGPSRLRFNRGEPGLHILKIPEDWQRIDFLLRKKLEQHTLDLRDVELRLDLDKKLRIKLEKFGDLQELDNERLRLREQLNELQSLLSHAMGRLGEVGNKRRDDDRAKKDALEELIGNIMQVINMSR